MENSSEFYYEKLRKDEKPGSVLAAFYCNLYNIPVTRSEYMMFNKLLRVFSRFTIFSAIMDMHGSKPGGIVEPFPYLYEICKRRFEAAHPDSLLQARTPLDKFIEDIYEEIERNKKKKLKIPSLEGLD